MTWYSVLMEKKHLVHTVIVMSVNNDLPLCLTIICSLNNCRYLVFVCLQLALYVLSFLEPRDLLRAAQTCRNWRFLAEDNLLWREKCREAGIDEVRETIHRRRQRVPSVTSPWKVSA